ncbi:MAG: phosphatidylserine synthase [Bacteroidota bacterium]|nr:phosphatidylserine synthase [Bacteroidota bacterium]
MKKQIPNALTVLNLISGCLGITVCLQNQFYYVPYLMGIALLADFLDGYAARLLNADSSLGVQLDSLADMVTFGLLPAVMLFKVSSFSMQAFYFGIHFIRYIVFIYSVAACFRLAKFNIDTRQKQNFLGLATPAAAIFVLGYYCNLFYAGHINPAILKIFYHPYSILAVTLIISILMVTEIRLFSLKGNPFSWTQNKFRVLFLIACVPQIIFLDWIAFSTIIITYIFFSMLQNAFEKEKVIS